MAFIRKIKTASGATAIQIAHKRFGKIIRIEHIGSGHTQTEIDTLISLAKKQIQGGQQALFPERNESLQINLKKSYSGLLYRILKEQYHKIGFYQLNDDELMYLCIARIVEPTSKIDSLRVLSDLGINGLNKDKLYRCLKRVIAQDYRSNISKLCFSWANSQGIALVLYDVTTLYFEIQKEDNYRKPGLSKERRLEPQIIVGLLTNQDGFPLGLHSFEGNVAETNTLLPMLEQFKVQHDINTITVVADAAMLSTKNLQELSNAGYRYIVGSRMYKIPYEIAEYQKTQELTDNQIIVSKQDSYRVIYQYRTKRAALDIRNIKKQLLKAELVINGKIPAKKTVFVEIKTKEKKLNQKLIDKAYALAGIKGYVTSLDIPDLQIISIYHQLFQVEASFRMAKSDLKARPIYHRKRDSIEAHLTIVFAAMAISKCIETQAGISIRKFIQLLRPIRSGIISINSHEHIAEGEISKNIQKLIDKLSGH